MITAISKTLTFVVVLMLIILLVPLVGPFFVRDMPQFAEAVGQILGAIWDGFLRVLHNFGSTNH
jgi:hypothetical protein